MDYKSIKPGTLHVPGYEEIAIAPGSQVLINISDGIVKKPDDKNSTLVFAPEATVRAVIRSAQKQLKDRLKPDLPPLVVAREFISLSEKKKSVGFRTANKPSEVTFSLLPDNAIIGHNLFGIRELSTNKVLNRKSELWLTTERELRGEEKYDDDVMVVQATPVIKNEPVVKKEPEVKQPVKREREEPVINENTGKSVELINKGKRIKIDDSFDPAVGLNNEEGQELEKRRSRIKQNGPIILILKAHFGANGNTAKQRKAYTESGLPALPPYAEHPATGVKTFKITINPDNMGRQLMDDLSVLDDAPDTRSQIIIMKKKDGTFTSFYLGIYADFFIAEIIHEGTPLIESEEIHLWDYSRIDMVLPITFVINMPKLNDDKYIKLYSDVKSVPAPALVKRDRVTITANVPLMRFTIADMMDQNLYEYLRENVGTKTSRGEAHYKKVEFKKDTKYPLSLSREAIAEVAKKMGNIGTAPIPEGLVDAMGTIISHLKGKSNGQSYKYDYVFAFRYTDINRGVYGAPPAFVGNLLFVDLPFALDVNNVDQTSQVLLYRDTDPALRALYVEMHDQFKNDIQRDLDMVANLRQKQQAKIKESIDLRNARHNNIMDLAEINLTLISKLSPDDQNQLEEYKSNESSIIGQIKDIEAEIEKQEEKLAGKENQMKIDMAVKKKSQKKLGAIERRTKAMEEVKAVIEAMNKKLELKNKALVDTETAHEELLFKTNEKALLLKRRQLQEEIDTIYDLINENSEEQDAVEAELNALESEVVADHQGLQELEFRIKEKAWVIQQDLTFLEPRDIAISQATEAANMDNSLEAKASKLEEEKAIELEKLHKLYDDDEEMRKKKTGFRANASLKSVKKGIMKNENLKKLSTTLFEGRLLTFQQIMAKYLADDEEPIFLTSEIEEMKKVGSHVTKKEDKIKWYTKTRDTQLIEEARKEDEMFETGNFGKKQEEKKEVIPAEITAKIKDRVVRNRSMQTEQQQQPAITVKVKEEQGEQEQQSVFIDLESSDQPHDEEEDKAESEEESEEEEEQPAEEIEEPAEGNEGPVEEIESEEEEK